MMCLYNQEKVEIPELACWKIFSNFNGGLQSAFASKYKRELYYEPLVRTRVDDEDETFMAFERLVDAYSVTVSSNYNFVCQERVVLPVVLYEVVVKGTFIQREGFRTSDVWHVAYASKEIVVKEETEPFYRLVRSRTRLSPIERAAWEDVL